jgi:chromosome segregation ATPase
MINSPTDNIVLRDQDALAIEEAQKRLLNIETLVSISNKNLKTIKIDTENITKERLGQEELLNNLVSKNKELTDLITSLEATKESKVKEIGDANDELTKIKSQSIKIEADLSQREDVISKKEVELVTRETNITSKEKELADSKEILDEKHSKINAFVANI